MSAGESRTREGDDAFVRKLGDRLKRQPAMGLVLITVAADGAASLVQYGCDRGCLEAAFQAIASAYSAEAQPAGDA